MFAGAGWVALSVAGGIISAASAAAHGVNVVDLTGLLVAATGFGGFLLNVYKERRENRPAPRRTHRR